MRLLVHRKFYWNLLLPTVLFAAVIAFAVISFGDASNSAEERQYAQTLTVIEKAVTSCYAIEGRYPPNITYLKENYGVIIDESRFIVLYDVFASNIRPGVRLIVKGSGGVPIAN